MEFLTLWAELYSVTLGMFLYGIYLIMTVLHEQISWQSFAVSC